MSSILKFSSDEIVFFDCNEETGEVIVHDGETKINNHLFAWCTDITIVYIPDGVTSIGDNAFDRCINLKKINIPKSVTSIGYRAFFMCANLKSIYIPDSVKKIDDTAFEECDSLTIFAPAGSYVENYAKKNEIPFVAK